jgi:hypothetical protein
VAASTPARITSSPGIPAFFDEHPAEPAVMVGVGTGGGGAHGVQTTVGVNVGILVTGIGVRVREGFTSGVTVGVQSKLWLHGTGVAVPGGTGVVKTGVGVAVTGPGQGTSCPVGTQTQVGEPGGCTIGPGQPGAIVGLKPVGVTVGVRVAVGGRGDVGVLVVKTGVGVGQTKGPVQAGSTGPGTESA